MDLKLALKRRFCTIIFYGMRDAMPEKNSEEPLTIRKIVFSPIDSFFCFLIGVLGWGS